MNDMQNDALRSFRNLCFGRQRDLIEECGGYKRVMDLTGRSKSEVCRWQGGADQDYMPAWAVYILEKDCGRLLITTMMADLQGCRLTDPVEERQAEVNLHRAYAERVRRRAETDLAYAAAIEDGHVSPTEATVIGRALSAEDRAGADLQGAVAVLKAQGGAAPGDSLRVIGTE